MTHESSIVIAAATQVERNGWSPVPAPVEWGKDPDIPGMIFARWHFNNGFGASVISGPRIGTELAVIEVGDGFWPITYTTSITNDVEPVSSEAELMDLLRRIQAL